MLILQHITFYWSEINVIQHDNILTYNVEYSDQCCIISKPYSHIYLTNMHKMVYDFGIFSKYKLLVIPSRINKCDDDVAHLLNIQFYSSFVEINVLSVSLLQILLYFVLNLPW